MPLDKMGKFVTYIYERLSKTNIDYTLEISFPICLVEEDVWDNLLKENLLERIYNNSYKNKEKQTRVSLIYPLRMLNYTRPAFFLYSTSISVEFLISTVVPL